MTGNWGRWGVDDEVGALNLVTPEVTRRALGLVRSGRTLSLAQPLGPATPGPPHRHPPARFMDRDAGDYALGARTPGGFRFAEDTVQFATHSGTHLDALSHAWSGEQLFNGHPQAGTRSTRGPAGWARTSWCRCSPAACWSTSSPPPAARCRPAPRSGRPTWSAASPRSASRWSPGTPSWSGPAGGSPTATPTTTSPTSPASPRTPRGGWPPATCPWSGRTTTPSSSSRPNPASPPTWSWLHQHGVPLAENVVLAELAGELAAQARSTFLLVLAPVPLVGSTGSPVAPVAVL